MSQSTGSSTRRPVRNFGLAVVAVCAGAMLLPSASVSRENGPFGPFLGSWRGSGRVVAADGQSEPISCRATYTGSSDNTSLSQSLVCASDSYRFNVRCTAEADGGNMQGHWQETTRNVEGDLSGQIDSGDFEGVVSGAGFTAQISLRANGRRQVVVIRPSAGDVAEVKVSLSR